MKRLHDDFCCGACGNLFVTHLIHVRLPDNGDEETMAYCKYCYLKHTLEFAKEIESELERTNTRECFDNLYECNCDKH